MSTKAFFGSISLSLREKIAEYGRLSALGEDKTIFVDDNPYRRRITDGSGIAHSAECRDGSGSVTPSEWMSINRALNSIYERDFVFLPRTNFEQKRQDFLAFYGPELSTAGNDLRPELERVVFSDLDESVGVSGSWTDRDFVEFYNDYSKGYAADNHQNLLTQIRELSDPHAGVLFYLVQGAADFLVESSAMGRNTLGNYGPVQSELFKILIDECGYGVDHSRHSTLYQEAMKQFGLDATPHTYWQFYLPETLYAANYYNYISRDHRFIFKYMGALLHVETGFRVTTGQVATLLSDVCGADVVDTTYFSEHAHIDIHHAQMALNNIAVQIYEQFGGWALKQVVMGFEESRLVGDRHLAALRRQLDWMAAIGARADEGLLLRVGETSSDMAARIASVTPVEMANTRINISVRKGRLGVLPCVGSGVSICSGESLKLEEGTLFALNSSEDCQYDVQAISA